MFKITREKLAVVAILFLAAAASSQTAKSKINNCLSQSSAGEFAQYEGRFAMDGGLVLVSKTIEGQLTVRPIVWTSIQTLRRSSGDAFAIEGRSDRLIEFGRDADGCVDKVSIAGFGSDGTFRKLGEEKAPIELLLSGEPAAAAESMIKADPENAAAAVSLGRIALEMVPSKASLAARFFDALSRQFPADAAIYSALGDGYIQLGETETAKKYFQRAHRLNPNEQAAVRGLRRLGLLSPTAAERAAGWSLPFSLDRLFAPPTKDEVKTAETDWAKRDLSPSAVQEVARGELNLGTVEAAVRIISHTVRGQRNFGAIIIPSPAEKGINPVILDLKGVSPSFFPLTLDDLISPKILAERQDQFIYFVPSFRGETLKFGGKDYVSEGDPTDSWDGATDDSLAFLNAALSVTPQADRDRIAVFGKSRGGTLAMLAGVRNRRIKRVISWSGPVDWFELMGNAGWPEKAIVADALLKRVEPQADGGQFVRTFLTKAVNGDRSLEQVRLHMLQSSPLYFADRFPATQAYYGIEDRMVPVRNGEALEKVLKNRESSVFFHPDAGHDLNPKLAFPDSKKFLLAMLSK